MRNRRNLRRAARLGAAGVAAAMGALLLAAQAVAAVTGASSSTSSDPVTLADDDGAVAMFTATNVGGGDVMSRCLQVTYESSGPADLKMYAALTAAGLAPYLHLVVESGSGGSFADCSGFAGSVLYNGTLAAFAGAHTDFASGLTVPVTPSANPVSFRFTVQVGNQAAAQGRTAAADFWWEAQTVDASTSSPGSPGPSAGPTAPAEPTAPAPAVVPSPAVSATPDGGGTPSDAAAFPAASTEPTTGFMESPASPAGAVSAPAIPVRVRIPPADATQQAAASGGLSLAAPATGTTGSGHAVRRHGSGRALPVWLGRAANFAAIAGKRTGFPILMLLLAFSFLVMQDRIDRREPKLALAPVHAEPDLPFEIPEEQS